MFENCREPNDYIEEIFRLGLKEDYSRGKLRYDDKWHRHRWILLNNT